MKPVARTILLLTVTVLVAQVAAGQTVSGPAGAYPGSQAGPSTCRTTMSIRPFTAIAGPTTPYSAIRESFGVQTLSDGTHITEKPQQEKIYRDSQGRTRTERAICPQAVEDPEGLVVQIHDPVSGFGYILDLQSHLAYKYGLRVRQQTPPHALTGNKTATSAAQAIEAPSDATRKSTTESLGTQTIEGLSVEGTRMTEVIPAGAQGNDRPMNVVDETWSSPDLKLTLLSKHSDPRIGERTVRVINVDTSEPSPLLFEPPADCKIVEESDRVTITYKRP